MIRLVLLCVALGGLLVGAVWISATLWTDMGEVEISRGGLLAIAGGAVFTMLLGGGLMALVFYSSRKGHDDAVESSEDTLREARRRFAQHKARRNWRRRP